TVCAGSQAAFSVTASGAGLSYQWRKGGINLTDDAHISGSTTASLTINPAGTADAGNYDVVVSGTCSPSVTSTPVALSVNVSPAVTLNPANQSVSTGQSASFTASASGSPAPGVQWQESDDGGTSFSNLSGQTSTTLSFTASV